MDKKDFESLLNKYPDCVSDGKKLKAFLKDLFPDVPKAIVNTLTIMADDGIISEMQKAGQTPLVSARLQKKLEDDYGLSQKIISQCFSLIPNNAKQTKSTINAGSYEKITSFIDTQPTVARRKEVPQKLDILQPEYDPKDFEIVKRVLKKYKGSSSVVVIPNSVTSIGMGAFSCCTGLTSITIPDSVTSIDNEAFYGCTGLTSVTIGNGVTSIGWAAFVGCSKLTSILVADGNTKYHSSGNCLIETASKTLILGCKTSVIPSDGSVTSIGEYAFKKCTELTSVTIPNSVTSIGNWAFYECSSLTSVTIPNSVTSIGYEAFSGCSGLKNVTIPDSVTSIGSCAFSDCSGLTSITIPNRVTSIGEYAFYECSSLTSVTIPNSVTSIGYAAFSGCSGLKNVTIPDSVTSIGDSAFWGCGGLTSVTIPNSMTSIGDSAFKGCTGLTSVTIPDSVTSIDRDAFRGCSKLKIYCEAKSELSVWNYGWNNGWNPDNRPVVWGVKK